MLENLVGTVVDCRLTIWLILGVYLGLPASKSVKCLTPKLLQGIV